MDDYPFVVYELEYDSEHIQDNPRVAIKLISALSRELAAGPLNRLWGDWVDSTAAKSDTELPRESRLRDLIPASHNLYRKNSILHRVPK